MLSRLAENLYWHGRYLERAEDLARLVNVNTHLNLDLPGALKPSWEPLVRITGHSEQFFEFHGDETGERQVVGFLLADERNPGSIRSVLGFARENMRSARDLMPREVWERMNSLYLKGGKQLSGNLSKRRRHEFLSELILDCQQIAGMVLGSMSQDHAYDFILIGRYLERADMTTRTLDVRSEDLLGSDAGDLPPYESIQWMSVLKSLTAYQMYRRHVRLRVNGNDVLGFLLRDRRFPRSVMFCLSELARLVEALPAGDEQTALRAATRMMRSLNEAQMTDLRDKALSGFMDELQVELGGIHDAIARTWFGSAQTNGAVREPQSDRP